MLFCTASVSAAQQSVIYLHPNVEDALCGVCFACAGRLLPAGLISTAWLVLCTMRAALFSSLLLAGLLIMQCSLQVHCSEAAAVKRKVKPHHHMPVKDPEEQKTQSLLQERPRRSHAQQLVPVAPLNPACVPKYVTDLVIPPPMPVAPPGGVLAEVSRAFLARQFNSPLQAYCSLKAAISSVTL